MIVSGFAVAVAVAGLGFASVALAQPAQQACAPDIRAYCAGVPQGEGRIAKCLREHKPQLSPACQRGMAQTATLMKEVVMACEDDLHQFCAGAAPGTAKELPARELPATLSWMQARAVRGEESDVDLPGAYFAAESAGSRHAGAQSRAPK